MGSKSSPFVGIDKADTGIYSFGSVLEYLAMEKIAVSNSDQSTSRIVQPSEVLSVQPLSAQEESGDSCVLVVPEVLQRRQIELFREEFNKEYLPLGPTETALVNDLARHAAGMQRWDEASGAVERQAVFHLPDLAMGGGHIEVNTMDAVLAGAMSSDAADRCEKHSLLRSRSFLRTLEKLQTVQANRRERERLGYTIPPLGFADEAACEQYLADRLHLGIGGCPECGKKSGYILPKRKCWECRSCKTQIGLRAKTVMARSPVPLLQWFDAIRLLLWRPTINAPELANKIGLQRLPTVRTMMAKIRVAMAADNSSECLAGLDRHYAH